MLIYDPVTLDRAATTASAALRTVNQRYRAFSEEEVTDHMTTVLHAAISRARDDDDQTASDWIACNAHARAASGFSSADIVFAFAAARRAVYEAFGSSGDEEACQKVELAVTQIAAEFVSRFEQERSGTLGEADRALALLSGALPMPLLLVNGAGRVTHANDALASFVGSPNNGFVGRRAVDLHPTLAAPFADPETVQRWLRGAAAAPERTHEAKFASSTGGWFSLQSLPAPTTSYQGRLLLLSDITDSVAAGDQAERLSVALVRAQERERARIASEIHDGPVQLLAATLMRLDRLTGNHDVTAREEIAAALRSDLRSAYAELRSLLFNLRPETLTRDGIAAAASELLHLFEQETGITGEVQNHLARPKRGEQALTAFRVLQEALTNVRKHADAHTVTVHLEGNDDLRFEISDDGRGFNPNQIQATPLIGHIGLATMRERVEFAGGNFTLRSSPGTGTHISAWLPPFGDR